jgi:hypothetical protein
MSNVLGNEPRAASISKAATHRWFVVLVAIYISAHVQMSVLPEDINIEFIAPRNNDLTWDDDVPRNLRIAFIGDSITRFQVLSLLYFLRTGNWTDVSDPHAKLFDSHQYESWDVWMADSIDFMQPHGRCDCYRGGDYNTSAASGSWWDMINENRYYRDEQSGNCITFLSKFGQSPINGHWAPRDVYNGPMALDQNHFTPYSYRYNWSEAIEYLLAELVPKPDFVVLNAGLHHTHDLGWKHVRQSIQRALNKTGIVGIYKTTTYTEFEARTKKMTRDRLHDHYMCRLLGHCVNMSWTLNVSSHRFIDKLHFVPPVYNRMNQQLLRYLKNTFC